MTREFASLSAAAGETPPAAGACQCCCCCRCCRCGAPSQPTDASTPSDPGQPAQPTQPSDPGQPTQPGTPAEPAGPTDCWHAPPFDPDGGGEGPGGSDGKGRTVVISDVHMGNGAKTCWYQRAVHEPYLAAVLDYVIAHASGPDPVTKLVVLGDLFDFWTYPPDQRPPTIDDIVAANEPILGDGGKLRDAVNALDGNVVLLRGNHDIELTQKTLNRLPLGDHQIELVDDLIVDPSGIVLTHGHLFTMFNAPDPRFPKDVPVGHFVSRAIAHYLENTLAPGQTAADLHDQGSPYGFDLHSFIPALEADLTSPSVTSTLLDYITTRCGLSESEPIQMADGSTTTIAAVKKKYDGLWTEWVDAYGGGEAGETVAAKAAQADYDGSYMAWWAQKATFDHGARGAMTGHTHHPREGIQNSRCVYVNCGFECPSTPDIADGAAVFNFGVISSAGTPELWSVTAEDGTYCVKRDTSGHTDQIVYAPFSDFSCYVTIANTGSKALEKSSESADNGYYVSAPPQTIAPGDTAEIWLQDLAGIHGAEGGVTYHQEGDDSALAFVYGCPTGIFSNYASGGSAFVASSGSPPAAGQPANTVPAYGHPLWVDFGVTDDVGTGPGEWTPRSLLALAVDAAGFRYDPRQDIIYSKMDPLQRSFGYAYGYDAAAVAMSAIIDCEPIFFEYGGKSWMIELWKGQYGLETGCEIGVYNRAPGSPLGYSILDATVGQRAHDPDPAHSRFFDCANDSERLMMSSTLYRNGQKLFSRGPERHWWLTGFKWGVLSEPEDLTMDVSIECLDATMTAAFTGALNALGYTGVQTNGNTVTFVFDRPKTPQPRDDVPQIVSAVRVANQQIVSAYDSLNLTSNDPNTVGDQAAATIGRAFALYTEEFFASVVANLAKQFGVAVVAAIGALTNAFGIALDAAAQFINNAGYAFAAWVAGIGSLIDDAFNFSCVVEISNLGGPYELTRSGYGIVTGNWGVEPPAVIPPGGVGRFWLRDPKPSAHGAEGWVTYAYTDSGGVLRQVTFTFDDPTGVYSNVVTVSSPAFGYYTKSGSASAPWSALNHQTGGGHPFFSAFVWGNGPIPPDA